jgi:hypothetical protein
MSSGISGFGIVNGIRRKYDLPAVKKIRQTRLARKIELAEDEGFILLSLGLSPENKESCIDFCIRKGHPYRLPV